MSDQSENEIQTLLIINVERKSRKWISSIFSDAICYITANYTRGSFPNINIDVSNKHIQTFSIILEISPDLSGYA